MNEAILGSAQDARYSCTGCSSAMQINSKLVRDQPLACGKCGNTFHKKCTNKRDARGNNWQKTPWFCPSCILSPHPSLETITSQKRKAVSDTALAAKRPTPQLEDNAIIDVTSVQHAGALNPSAAAFQPLQILVSNPAPATNLTPNIRYPNNSIRQKTSNLATADQEKEFQKTALDSFRSTIATQQTDINRLKECMDVRNKQIMQLERQVSHASSLIASPTSESHPSLNSTPGSPILLPELQESLKSIHLKLDLLSKTASSPVNNININNGGDSWKPVAVSSFNQSVQADLPCVVGESNRESTTAEQNHPESFHDPNSCPLPSANTDVNLNSPSEEAQEIILTCTVCEKVLGTSQLLDDHMEAEHRQHISETLKCDYCEITPKTQAALSDHIESSHTDNGPYDCDKCGACFTSLFHLNKHTEADHAPKPLQCSLCNYECNSVSHLNYHSASSHGLNPSSTPVSTSSLPTSSPPTTNPAKTL